MRGTLLFVIMSGCVFRIVDKPGDGFGDSEGEDPGIALVTPADGDGSYAGSFDMAWEVTGVELDADAIGGEAREGKGHVHVYVDDVLVEETADESFTVDGLTDGAHTLRVELATNDHEELGLGDQVDVAVAHPSLTLTSPADGTVLAASSTPLAFTVDGFTLVDAGAANHFDEGHYAVYVDGELHDWGSDPLTALAGGMTEGTHEVKVALVANDGRPIDPPIEATVGVEVPVGASGVYWDRSTFVDAFDSATVPVGLSASGITLVPSDGTLPPVDGEGHIHIYLDGVWLTSTADTSMVLQHMGAGDHVFEARLASNDSIEMPVVDRMHVVVADTRPDTLVTYPGAGWRMAPDFNLTFDTENFTLDAAAMDSPNAEHEGHAQLWLDGVLVSETGLGTIPVTGLAVGTHRVRLQLANNDRTPVEPAVYDEFDVIVQ